MTALTEVIRDGLFDPSSAMTPKKQRALGAVNEIASLVQAADHVCMEFWGGEVTDGSASLLTEEVEKWQGGVRS